MPRSAGNFEDRLLTQGAITGLGLISSNQRTLDQLVLICHGPGKIPSCGTFPYLELHCYSHWSHTELYISSTASNCLVIIIFIGGSVTHYQMVMQETTILQNKQSTNNIASHIIKVLSRNEARTYTKCIPVYSQVIWLRLFCTKIFLSGKFYALSISLLAQFPSVTKVGYA